MNSPVTPLQYEPNVYMVQSLSRPDLQHRVEIESGVVACFCEQAACKNDTNCRHVELVRAYVAGFYAGRAAALQDSQ